MPRVLRCVDTRAALHSLASLFNVPPNEVKQALVPAVTAALADNLDPIGALPAALAGELNAVAEPPDTIHYFHGTRARDPVRFAAEGLRPLLAMLDGVWAELAALAPELPASDVHRLREDLTAGSVGPHTYSLRVNGTIDHGPCGHLVLDALLHPDSYDAVDYLKGPEIPSDICGAVRERFGIDLGNRYRAATTPCIVEFAMPGTSVDEALASAAWYVEAALRGERSANANWGYDGSGVPVPASAIVAVYAPCGSVLPRVS
jgi:hypothetical protein